MTTKEIGDFGEKLAAKFLKKNKTEEQEITNIINRIVLANPLIKFT